MRKDNRKGFTIVELVIVIAVIAILAGVLIPTFGGMIKKANESKALQEAKNAYTADLALLDGQAENYAKDAYKVPTYTAVAAEATFDASKTYYTKTGEDYAKAEITKFESGVTYYTVTYGDSICTGTFSGTDFATYEVPVGEYTCTYDGSKWTVKEEK